MKHFFRRYDNKTHKYGPISELPENTDHTHGDPPTDVTGWETYRKTASADAVRIDDDFQVSTIEGIMHGKVGDYLMRGAHGEPYVCDAQVFADTYAPVREPTDAEVDACLEAYEVHQREFPALVTTERDLIRAVLRRFLA